MKSLQQRHDEAGPLLGAYALDAVQADEREEIDGHLEECSICADEVAQHREVVATMLSDDAAPPADLWDRVVDQMDEAPPPMRLVPVAKAAGGSWASTRGSSLLAAAVGMAAAVTAIVGLGVVRESSRINDLEDRLASATVEQAAIAADQDPTNTHLSLVSDDGRYVVDVVMTSERRGFVTGGRLPEVSDDRTYQLWAIGDNGAVSLGLLGDELDAAAFVMPEGSGRLAVTAEPEQGAVVPSGQPVVSSPTLDA